MKKQEKAPLNKVQETAVIGWVAWEEDGKTIRAGILVERNADGIITNVSIKEEETQNTNEVGTNDGSNT